MNQVSINELKANFEVLKNQKIDINMMRGLPSKEQLDLSSRFMMLPGNTTFQCQDGSDWKNYGGLQGIKEVRELFAKPLFSTRPGLVAIGENSSLALMHECMSYAFIHGVPDGEKPWGKQERIKFLCPSPGYDRHFSICESFGIEMITVPMTDNGPDMDIVEKLVSEDSSIKGIWCVPKYSNPTGAIYSIETVSRLASLSACTDFRIFWDNAYAVHHLTEDKVANLDILELCRAAGHENRVVMFASTSKIVYPGSGLAFFAASSENIEWWLQHRSHKTIGPDKLNQVRHLSFFENEDGIVRHMEAHARLLAEKFDIVDQCLTELFSYHPEIKWTRPKGGYFISLDVPSGCAKRTVELAKQAGVSVTPAGATFPKGIDPQDSNIRIAPTYLDVHSLKRATHILGLAVQLAAAERFSALPG
ncbi:aminotransferase class I/II-fold pyridoxal phosphate-dependent enzyme [Acinetobacter sp. ANC 3882]|uniref:aminotransferase class I/II-fold pyridoxal phosphate-dependent enzyme n=1 Tax=Acinetobacter sp. ANC 3882 TaxID=2923423 RepID=UPI001F4A6311|nr:aminotransferase class I/II-fold pyridoxal phosphate-dependent enzyme [Acinetobacter sp. ANC 3882]MCH7312790.1 aminotransferase class I/II-fold pyridoxal phosphate-dependent enzyme [Acinetobacter sp. ANC 3882]